MRLKGMWFAILAFFVWSGVATETLAAGEIPNVQHMKVISRNSGGIILEETWYDPQTTDTRIDSLDYSFSEGKDEQIIFNRSITTEKGKQRYTLTNNKGKITETNRSLYYPSNEYEPYNSLFTSIASKYRAKEWVPTGTVEFNGKQVTKLKRVVTLPKGEPDVTVAYLDPVTGLPVKEELYIGVNNSSPITTKIYFFDEMKNDPTNSIFILPSQETRK